MEGYRGGEGCCQTAKAINPSILSPDPYYLFPPHLFSLFPLSHASLLKPENKKLSKLRKSLFRITKAGRSEELERLLKEEFGTEIKMSDIKHPK